MYCIILSDVKFGVSKLTKVNYKLLVDRPCLQANFDFIELQTNFPHTVRYKIYYRL